MLSTPLNSATTTVPGVSMALEGTHRKGGPHDDQGREAGATKEEAPRIHSVGSEGTYLGVPVGFQYLQKRYCPSALTR